MNESAPVRLRVHHHVATNVADKYVFVPVETDTVHYTGNQYRIGPVAPELKQLSNIISGSVFVCGARI